MGVAALEKAFITLDGTTRSNLDDLSRRTLGEYKIYLILKRRFL